MIDPRRVEKEIVEQMHKLGKFAQDASVTPREFLDEIRKLSALVQLSVDLQELKEIP
jgi:hypothetical protein